MSKPTFVDQTAVKAFLIDLGNVATVRVKYSEYLYSRLASYHKSHLKLALQIAEDYMQDVTFKLPHIIALLNRAVVESDYQSDSMPEKGSPEFAAIWSKLDRIRGTLFEQIPPGKMGECLLRIHNGYYDDYLQEAENALIFSGTKQFGDDWRACKAHHVKLTNHLPGHSSGKKIPPGTLTGLLMGVTKPLPYNPAIREPGISTPPNRYQYDESRNNDGSYKDQDNG